MSDELPTPPVPIPGLHAGSKSDFREDLDVEELIERNRCHEDYYKLEKCLADYDRDWRKCQEQVKKLKECNDRIHDLRQATDAATSGRDKH
ncbi:unnamed protein product [Peronospora farinosa]|uniref:CHCH domain-containing protein n=1 Tax=Peronospora farinosa TaxID=134698 RepID=A0AAV0T5S6_9STRA|nr:unnamed protein product [Peronospora farinosa]CAI5713650.1 unnamed protein product [Peronospora farinosa]